MEPVLTTRLTMHARLQGGSLHTYSVFHGDKHVGACSITRLRKKGKTTETMVFLLGHGDDAKQFDTLSAFKRAYAQQLQDEEWNAAVPQGENHYG